MYTLHVLWVTGEKSEYYYDTEHEAYIYAGRMRKIFGEQIDYYWIDRKRGAKHD